MCFSWTFCKNSIFSFLPHLCKLFFPYQDSPLKHGKWWVLRFLRESEDDKYWSGGKLSFSESFQVETDNEFVEWVSSWIIQLEKIWVTENSIHYHSMFLKKVSMIMYWSFDKFYNLIKISSTFYYKFIVFPMFG